MRSAVRSTIRLSRNRPSGGLTARQIDRVAREDQVRVDNVAVVDGDGLRRVPAVSRRDAIDRIAGPHRHSDIASATQSLVDPTGGVLAALRMRRNILRRNPARDGFPVPVGTCDLRPFVPLGVHRRLARGLYKRAAAERTDLCGVYVWAGADVETLMGQHDELLRLGRG